MSTKPNSSLLHSNFENKNERVRASATIPLPLLLPMAGDHKCPVCNATFTRPQHVARHMRSRQCSSLSPRSCSRSPPYRHRRPAVQVPALRRPVCQERSPLQARKQVPLCRETLQCPQQQAQSLHLGHPRHHLQAGLRPVRDHEPSLRRLQPLL
jgi:hypothetical protein